MKNLIAGLLTGIDDAGEIDTITISNDDYAWQSF